VAFAKGGGFEGRGGFAPRAAAPEATAEQMTVFPAGGAYGEGTEQ